MKKRLTSMILPIVLTVVLLVLLFLRAQYLPTYVGAQYRLDGSDEWYGVLTPLSLWDPSVSKGTFRMTMVLGRVHPTIFRVAQSDVLHPITVNGVTVTMHKNYESIDLGTLLRPGKNTIEGIVETKWEYPYLTFAMVPSFTDPIGYLFILGITVLSAFLAWTVVHSVTKKHRWLPWVALVGTALRVLHALTTPYWVNAYDWAGHGEYVLYVSRWFSIPPAQLGWETYQAPLYYFLAGLWLKASMALHLGFGSVQMLSVIISILVLFVGLWITLRLFPKESDQNSALCCAMLFAVFPGLIAQSSQISNDILWTLIGFVSIALLLRWHQTGKHRDWLWLSIAIGIGLLIKSNALILIPIAIGALILKRDVTLRWKARLCGEFLGILTLLSGWLFALRFVIEREQSVVGNIHHLDPALAVPNSLSSLLTFNPVQVLLHPFLDDISDPRRQYFLEYLFRSAHGGDMALPLLFAQIVLAFGMAMIVLGVIGLLRERKRNDVPLLILIAVVFFGSLLAYRWTYPFSANQHFRFITPLLIPCAACVAFTARNRITQTLVWTYIALCALLIVSECTVA